MSTKHARIKIKRSTATGEIPTVAPSSDHTDGTWDALDIYKGEFFINQFDSRFFNRTDSGIVEFVPTFKGTALGTDTYTLTGALTAYVDKAVYVVEFTNANTGAATLNHNSIGAEAIVDIDGNALGAGAIAAGSIHIIVRDNDNSQFRMISTLNDFPYLPLDGSSAMTGNLDMGNNSIGFLRSEINYNAVGDYSQTYLWNQGIQIYLGYGTGPDNTVGVDSARAWLYQGGNYVQLEAGDLQLKLNGSSFEATVRANLLGADEVYELPATGGTFALTSDVNSVDLSIAYTNGSDAIIGLESSIGGVIIRDNATPIAADLFAVQDSSGTTDYFKVDTSGIVASPDTDTTHQFGRLAISSPGSDIMYLSHFNYSGNASHYALRQLASGGTTLNSLGETRVAVSNVTKLTFSSTGVTVADGYNLIFGSTSGNQIGTATTQMIGFFGTTPIVQPTALTPQLTQITFTAPGTPDYALQDVTNVAPWGFADAEELRTFISVVGNLQTRVQEIEDKFSTASSGLGLIA